MIELIKNINSKFSVAGYENELTEYIVSNVKDYCDECYIDNIGNVICHKKGKGEKILINTPVSCDGIFVTHITDDKKIKFHTIGTIDINNLLGAKVKNTNGKIVGIILSSKKDKDITLEDLYIEYDEKETINIGDVLEPLRDLFEIGDNLYGSKLSKTVGTAVVIETIKNLKSDKDLYFSFSVMDNLGFKGAKASANKVEPDLCYTVAFSDTFNKETKISVGKGAVIRIKDNHIIVNKKLRDMLIKKISLSDIPYQLEIVTNNGLTNNEIMYLNNGILTANINCPVNQLNTLNEGINIEDVKCIVKSLGLVLV